MIDERCRPLRLVCVGKTRRNRCLACCFGLRSTFQSKIPVQAPKKEFLLSLNMIY